MSDPKFLRIVRQGDDLAKQNKFDSAIAKYQRALRMDPHSSEVRRKLIDMCKRKSAYREAILEYINWAEVCKRDGNYEQAIEIFQECLDMEKSSSSKKSTFFVRTPTADLGQIKDALDEYGAEIHWKLGLVYLAKGELGEAEVEFKKSVEMNPTNPAEIHKHLGLIYTEQGKHSEAIGEYQEVIRLTPDDASVYEQLGDICYKQHKDTNAIQWFSQAGDIYLKKNEVQEAIRVFENILKIESENIDILTKLSDIYLNEGLVDKAIQTSLRLADIYTKENLMDKVIILYERLLDWEPENNDVRLKVIEIYQKILQVDPGNLQARHKLINNYLAVQDTESVIPEFIALGKTYLEKNLYDDAISFCEKVFEFNAKNVDGHKLLAEIFVKQGLTDAAKEEYLMTMNLYREMGCHDKADETYQRMTSLFPDSADMHYELALNHLEKNQFDESIKEFKLVLESDPQHVPTLSRLGEIYIQKDMLEEGMENFKKILEVDGLNTDIRKKLSDVYLSIGQIDNGIEQLLDLGDTFIKNSEFENAVSVYRQILCYIPDNLEARERIVEIYYLQGDKERAKSEYIFLANVYDRRNIPLKAIEMCKKILELFPEDYSVRKKICKYYIKQGITDVAVSEYLTLSDMYIENGLSSSAIELLQAVIDIHPERNDIVSKLSEILSKEGKVEDAISQYFALVDNYIKTDRLDKAKDTYNKIIAMQPDNIDAHVKLIDLYMNSKDLEHAINIMENLAKIYNRKHRMEEARNIYQQIGDLCISEKMFDNALKNYEKIIELYSSDEKEQVSYYKKIIDILLEQKETDRALGYQQHMASILMKMGDFDTSVAEYKNIINSFLKDNRIADTIEIYRILIDIYLKTENFTDAIKECKSIAAIYLENKMINQALEIYHILIEVYTKSSEKLELLELHYVIGELYISQNNNEKSIEHFQIAASGFFDEGKVENSIKIYKKIISLVPEHIENRYDLINIYAKMGAQDKVVEEYCLLMNSQAESGNLDKATDIFNQSIKENSKEPTLYNCIANIYFDNQMWDDAIVNYLKVLDNDSKYQGVYSKLTLTCASKGDINSAVEWTKKLISSGKAYELVDNLKFDGDVDAQKAESYYNWGIIYKEIGFIEDSIRAFKASSKYSGRKLFSLKMIGECFTSEGFKELAVRQFRQILEVALDSIGISDDDYLELRYGLGDKLEKLGKLKDAKKAYEGICEINIKYKDTMEKIMELTRKIESSRDAEDADPKVIEFSFDND